MPDSLKASPLGPCDQHPRRLRQRGASVLGAAGVALTVACGAEQVSVAPSSARVAVDTTWVTGDARAALSSSGTFALSSAHAADEIDASRAQRLAEAWIRDFAPQLAPAIARHRGEAINVEALRVCERPFYARASHAAVGDSDVPLPTHRAYGAAWLVQLCDGGNEPVVALKVAANATDTEIVDGHVRFPPRYGNEFLTLGLAPGQPLPISPERAVQLARQATGQRVRAVPELIRIEWREAPHFAVWRVRLESSVSVRTERGSTVSDEILVGPTASMREAQVFAPGTAGALTDSIALPLPGPLNAPRRVQYIRLRRLPDIPRGMHAVIP